MPPSFRAYRRRSTPRRPRPLRRLTAAAVSAAAVVATLASVPAHAADPRLTVDLSRTTGAVLHGANGALYGLSDDGVPGDNLLAPLHLTTIAQKAPDGTQHPNGDALAVEPALKRDGGGQNLVYMQDFYSDWPYQNLGIDDYLAKVDTMVRRVAASPDASSFVFVPFNEPDWIWYGLNAADTATYRANRAKFESDWTAVYRRIRSIMPAARIAGPNEAGWDARFMGDFLPWAKGAGVLPDLITWHELSPSSLSGFDSHYAAYRALEHANGISPLPIDIDEYANRRDLSVPGQMVQWISMFERNKVYADQAYWDVAGNLSDNTAQTNIPNGDWWLLRWYAGLSGSTVQVTPPRPDTVDSLQGLASLDTSRRQVQVLLGGASGSVTTAVQHIPASFGGSVDVTVQRTGWSGYEGAAAAPRTLLRGTYSVGSDGSVDVPLTGLDPLAAYRITVNPAGSGRPAAASVPWSASYEAENAAVTDGTVHTQGSVSNANGYTTSGGKDVGSLNKADSKVAFQVTVPATGTYDLDVFYGNQSGGPATQTLTVDGAAATTVAYPSTLNWTYRSKAPVSLSLTAGTHTLTLAKGTNEVTLDKIDLTAATCAPTVYEAAYAETAGPAAYDYTDPGTTGTGSVRLGGGATTTFDVYAPSDAYYTVHVRYAATGTARLVLDGATVTLPPTGGGAADHAVRLFLGAGNNRLALSPGSTAGPAGLTLTDLRVDCRASSRGVTAYEAESGTLAGTAAATPNSYASGGSYVGHLGKGAGNTLSLKVNAPAAGRYVLLVRYANDELAGSGNYNTNVVSRAADITVGSGPAHHVMFRNTYGWSDFWTLPVPVDLAAGTNTVTFGNATAYAPDIDRVDVAAVAG